MVLEIWVKFGKAKSCFDNTIEDTKIYSFGLALSGIGSQPTRLSDVLNLKNLKAI